MNGNESIPDWNDAFHKGKADPVVDDSSTVFWFRRDLRLTDNAGLYHALKDNKNVVPLFIFDTNILDDLDDKTDRRVEFILDALAEMKSGLEAAGTSLLILMGDPVAIFKKISPRAVYTNGDYEPYARKRDSTIEKMLHARKAAFRSFKDQVIFEKDEIVKDDGTPYTIFTPYSRKWKSAITPFFLESYPTAKYFKNFASMKPLPLPTLTDLGFQQTGASFPKRVIPQSIIEQYDRQRNFPSVHGTTHLGVHLRFGTVSIRVLAGLAMKKNETWLKELIWREFYQMILWHFPNVQTSSFKSVYDQIEWRNHPDEFLAWCEGRTGYPLVDAGMRELNETGFMHNRVRMVTASFLTKHLLIDWRWGEAWFAKKLLDYDLAANNGGWQWAAGCGCDAAPYFRVFNPQLQMEKFDPEFAYVKKWVPEWTTPSYATPIVDHTMARERVLRVFKAAVDKK